MDGNNCRLWWFSVIQSCFILCLWAIDIEFDIKGCIWFSRLSICWKHFTSCFKWWYRCWYLLLSCIQGNNLQLLRYTLSLFIFNFQRVQVLKHGSNHILTLSFDLLPDHVIWFLIDRMKYEQLLAWVEVKRWFNR